MLHNGAKWYNFSPPRWSFIAPPLTPPTVPPTVPPIDNTITSPIPTPEPEEWLVSSLSIESNLRGMIDGELTEEDGGQDWFSFDAEGVLLISDYVHTNC